MSEELLPPLELEGRQLWLDGDVSVPPELLHEAILRTGGTVGLYVTELTPEVVELNALLDEPIQVKSKLNLEKLSFDWILPDAYKYLDLEEYLAGLHGKVERDELYEARLTRLTVEVATFKRAELFPMLRVLIYVLDELRRQNVVWGVGRGSSCSSYLLYLLGLHEVDAVRYDINLTDFIRD